MSAPGPSAGEGSPVLAQGERLHVAALLERGLHLSGRLLGYSHAQVQRLTRDGSALEVVAGTGAFRALVGRRFAAGDCLGWEVLEKKGMVRRHCQGDRCRDCETLGGRDWEILGMPIPGPGTGLGALLLARAASEEAAAADELPAVDLEALAALAGMVLEREDLYRELQEETRERERSVAAVRASEARLRAIVDGAGDAIFIRDREGRYLLANPAAAEHLGCSVGGMLGRRPRELVSQEDAALIEETDGQVLATERPVEYEVTVEWGGQDECSTLASGLSALRMAR